MDRTTSSSSGERNDASSLSSTSPSPGPFAYQTRLLERTSSRGSTGSLSRSGSQSGMGILASPSGTTTARRWAPTHRVGGSLDVVRGKWEALSNATGEDVNNQPDTTSQRTPSTSPVTPTRSTRYTSLLSSARRNAEAEPIAEYTTPVAMKRRTLPEPIIASPLSPNTTGVTIESPGSPPSEAFTSSTARIHLPVSTPYTSSPTSYAGSYASSSTSLRGNTDYITPHRTRRANTIESVNPASTGSSTTSEVGSISSVTSRTSFALLDTPSASSTFQRRPTSLYDGNHLPNPSSPDKPPYLNRTSSRASSASPTKQLASPSPLPSVMAPKPYVSSYMQKKASKYGETLGGGRKLGRHLPRIASGDGPEEPVVEFHKDEEPPPPARAAEPPGDDRRARRLERQRRVNQWQVPSPPEKLRHSDIVLPGATNGDDVVGIPGRVRLSRDKSAPTSPTSPLPSSRLTRGLWADVQRNLIQAYEYLCHVGEAQQWIEGCLGEELEFGVVEMEEGMRNGVVLAKLVRVFQGEAAVRRIYEAPKLDFRHSDNINHFFNFVRYVGLPESFIFELTDLYEKKNFPKVVYCIHALSHLLARRGMAERIGNLLGQLQFSDDQLRRTQKGLKESGVAMPNFGNVGRELAKEINEEPEEEEETEDERRDRLLLENEPSIVACQALARGFLIRKAQATQRVRIRLAERYVPKIQAHARAALTRRQLQSDRKERANLGRWAVALQTHVRGLLFRRQWRQKLRRVRALTQTAIRLQAQSRGVLQRRRYQKFKAAMRNAKVSVIQLQSLARAKIAQRSHHEVAKTFSRPVVMHSIVAFQAHARGALLRARMRKQLSQLHYATASIANLQAHARGVILRRRVRTQLATLENVADVVVRIQAAVRTYLARKRLLILIRGLRKATPAVVTLQARARANLARQRHAVMQKALSEVKVITSVGGFQSLARAALARNRHREQAKRLEFAEPDVVGFQAAARGALVRSEYNSWRSFLHRSHPHATILQAMLRGVMMRRKFRQKMEYYRSNLDKIIQIQSLYRAKETREQYRQLTLGTNVSVGTIKNFVHLLDDSEADFQEEIKVERLRTEVVKRIRENQALENDVNDLDVKIALVVQNVKSFEEVLKVRRKHGGDSAAVHAARASILAAHGDPFAGPSALDHAAKRKLELYQQLFYLLQTRGEYLTHLLVSAAAAKDWEKNRRLIERVVLTLFGYGHDRREDYLLLKFFQTAIHDEIHNAPTLQAITRGHPSFINIIVHYARTKQAAYVRETLQTVIREVVESDELDLEADPSVIYRTRIDLEETRSGIPSNKPRELPFHQAAKDPDTRAEYIRHLQLLVGLSRAFISAITQSTPRVPFAIRFLARETLAALRHKFPNVTNDVYAACIARLVFYRFINPAIITPETFDIVNHTVEVSARKNLAQISRVLTQITTGALFGEDNPCYVPINDFVDEAIQELTAWLIQVADVQDAETQFNAHEFLDATVQPKAIHISPNEVYTMHSVLSQHLDVVAPSRDDILRVILAELDGVPNFDNDELNDARDTAIELQLTNRFAHVRDPRADEKALWVQAKRAVLAILRVQPGQDLVESLMQPVTDEHELAWEDIIEETQRELSKHQRRMPSTTGAEAYRLEDIQAMTFREVKAHAIYFLLELEKQGKISRMDGYQGILNAIAGDVRSKNRRRVQRQHEKENLEAALRDLAERKKHFEDQINSYHNYVETAMSTMQRGKGKKRFIMPFTKQYFHMRDLQKAGKSPQFGSFKYSAQHFYVKGILLSIDQYSPRQFDKMDIVLSSNSIGVFTVEILNNALGITNRVAVGDIKMEDLLQAQFENRASLSLFNGLAKFNLNLLLWQINKKFYV
ncbi:ras GTPase-activating protein [Cristinia sonorae]|uniref:Ras GTPase-activating protein n=1 Tax=Cristinia sonorae TaxID=1940300 RepID=A0A8K0XTW7_9AGAR|nr:ras GTPase-activating protein [Cristinia sonorae]